MPREAYVETLFVELVRKIGGITVKIMPSQQGVPDRLALLPDGSCHLVELKSDEGYLHPAQRVWHARSAAIGHPVAVLRGADAVRKWVLAQSKNLG